MALGTNKISATAGAGVTAAATSRVGAGGRNVASVTQTRVEGSSFAPQIGVNNESILHYDDPGQGGDSRGQRRREDWPQAEFVALLGRGAGAGLAAAEQGGDAGGGRPFLTEMMRAVVTYEANMRATNPGSVRPGSVMNYLF